ncbi:hypothetical protein [Actinospica robiniae]|uniref:hypothetical protein n=1 Tax=Actinospica robiniae TaxID=304901 RepID=UPI00040E73BB|nr:hypothetical protein [Actinospica robiniae]
MSSNTPRAFTRDLISRIPFRTAYQSGSSALAKGYQSGSAAVAKGYQSGSAAATKGYQSGSAMVEKHKPAATKRFPAAALAVAAVGVAIVPLATSGAGDAQAAAATSPAAVTSTVQPGATASKAAQAPAQAPAQTETQSSTRSSTESTKTTPSNPYASVSMGDISPTSEQGSQSHISLTSAQWENATTIVHAAENMNLSPYASTIAVATAMQESKLHNLNVAVDHDSLGLFQQRPSTGWGSPSELTTPTYAAKAFLKSLPSNYQDMSLHTAAQDVQRSFNGSLYSQWQDQAKHIVYTIMHSS